MGQHYVTIKAAAPWTEESAKRLVSQAKQEAERQGAVYILFDLRDWVHADYELTRFFSGKDLSEVMRPPYKVAAFAHPEAITQFGENVAVTRGAQFRVFPDEASAVKWLLGEKE